MTTTTTRRGRLATAAALVALVLAAAEPSGAAKSPAIDALAVGHHVVLADGSVVVEAATVSYAKPFTGSVQATLTPTDGSLPGPGACEPATATYRLDGSRDRHIAVESVGDVCGKWTYPGVSGVTHVYTGRYVVTSSTPKRFARTDGFHDVRLSETGEASSFIIDT